MVNRIYALFASIVTAVEKLAAKIKSVETASTKADTITEGVFSVERGGTGESTPEEALKSLGGCSITKLWENASPTSSFETQWVELSLSEYDYIGVVVQYNTNATTGSALFASRRNTGSTTKIHCTLGYVSSSNELLMPYRRVTIAEGLTGLTFDNAYLSGTQDNSKVIPLEVIGIKGVQ